MGYLPSGIAGDGPVPGGRKGAEMKVDCSFALKYRYKKNAISAIIARPRTPPTTPPTIGPTLDELPELWEVADADALEELEEEDGLLLVGVA